MVCRSCLGRAISQAGGEGQRPVVSTETWKSGPDVKATWDVKASLSALEVSMSFNMPSMPAVYAAPHSSRSSKAA